MIEVLILVVPVLVVAAIFAAAHRRAQVVTVNDSVRLPERHSTVERDAFGPLGSIPGATMNQTMSGQVTLTSQWAPTWTFVVGILAFPVGLLLVLLIRQDLTLNIRFVEDGDGTLVQVAGRARKKVALLVGEAIERQRVSSAL